MALTGVLLETSINSTTSIPQLASGTAVDVFGESIPSFASSNGATGGVLVSGLTTTCAAASSGDEPDVVIGFFFRDTTPYPRTEARANRLYQRLTNKEKETEFPVVVCESKEVAAAMADVFAGGNREKMLDALDVLERLIGSPDAKLGIDVQR